MNTLSQAVPGSDPDRVSLGQGGAESASERLTRAVEGVPVEVAICPPWHKHGESRTCYVGHGCRCSACKARNAQKPQYRKPAAERVQRVVDIGVKEALAPCGTIGAARRHARKGEPLCAACREADRQYRQRHLEDQRRRELEATLPSVDVEDGVVVIRAVGADAKIIAAALLDRALMLEPSRYTSAGEGRTQEGQKAIINKLRLLHKKVGVAARAIEVDDEPPAA